MKILIVTNSLIQGGAEYQALALAKLLQSRNLNVEVYAISDYDFYLPFVNSNGIKYSCLSNQGSRSKKIVKCVKQIIKSKPDLVISYAQRASLVSMLAKCVSGFKFKLFISERTSQKKLWRDLAYFNLAIIANKVIVNSESKLFYLNKWFPIIKNKTLFVPNIIDLKRFNSISNRQFDAKQTRIYWKNSSGKEFN